MAVAGDEDGGRAISLVPRRVLGARYDGRGDGLSQETLERLRCAGVQAGFEIAPVFRLGHRQGGDESDTALERNTRDQLVGVPQSTSG